MTIELWVCAILMGAAAMVGVIWSARRIDRQHAQASSILARSTEQQQKSEEIQLREIELLKRWEGVVSRLEAIAASWESRAGAK